MGCKLGRLSSRLRKRTRLAANKPPLDWVQSCDVTLTHLTRDHHQRPMPDLCDTYPPLPHWLTDNSHPSGNVNVSGTHSLTHLYRKVWSNTSYMWR
jgi:hypothetical protein